MQAISYRALTVNAKSKNPARCSVVLALGESSSKAICQKRKIPIANYTTRPHSTLRGYKSLLTFIA
jgi:hypothetical protein